MHPPSLPGHCLGPSPVADERVRFTLQRAIVEGNAEAFRTTLRTSHPELAGQRRLFGVLLETPNGLRTVLVDVTGERLPQGTVIEANMPIDLLNVQFRDGQMLVRTDAGVWSYAHPAARLRLGHIAVYKLCIAPEHEAPELREVSTALRLLLQSSTANLDPPMQIAQAAIGPGPSIVLPCALTAHSAAAPWSRALLDLRAVEEHPGFPLYGAYDVEFRAVADPANVRRFRVYLFCAATDGATEVQGHAERA